jgi:peptidyl-prolyl cis-trans isomerase D
MLEAIRAHSQGWLAKLILTLIAVPFALFGIDAYLKNAGSDAAVAKVAGSSVSVVEYRNAMQSLRNKMQSEGQKDLSLLDTPQARLTVLNRLINTRLLNAEAQDSKFKISNEQLSEFVITLPEFQQNGKFSQEVYDKLLTQNQMTPSKFENMMRGELVTQQVRDGIPPLAFAIKAVEDRAIKTELQQREVTIAEIKSADFISQVKVDDAEVKAYYEKHKDKFQVQEQVKLEFVRFSANDLIMKMQVTDEDSKRFYNENAAKFQGDEKRRASHILIGFGPGATPEAKAQAKKKAEEILAEVKKNPAKFAELAKKNSQDPGSAEKGGDLGMFGRGAMVKAFEDAAYSMKPGQVSDLVQSEFGFHIIKLTEVSGQAQSYESLKPQIRAELMYQKALAKFSEEAENFNNLVYEQSSSLKPAADNYGLQVQKTDWVSATDGAKFFKNDKLMSLVFSNEVLIDKRNTEAVEVANNTLVAARVVEHKAAAPRSFDEVKAGITDFLKIEKASKLAIDQGNAALSSLKKNQTVSNIDWIPAVTVDRKNAQGLTELTMSNVFKIDTTKLPSYTGVSDSKKGFLLIKVVAVHDADEDTVKAASADYKAALTAEYGAAYIATLKTKNKVSVNQRLLMGDMAAQ